MCTQLFDVKQDYVFKRIFGSETHPEVLVSLLNACFKSKDKIKTVKIKNSTLEKEFIENSYSRLDILATTDQGEIINIEMQRADEKNMVNRSLYYWSRAYAGQYSGKQRYENISRTVCINILEYNLDELLNESHYHNTFHLKNQSNNILSDIIEIQFIELPKLIIDQSDSLSLWMSFVEDPNSEEVLKAEHQIQEIHQAREELARLSRDPKEAEIYRQRADAIAEKYNALLGAEDKGKQKGIEEGLKEGLKKGKKAGIQEGKKAGIKEGLEQGAEKEKMALAKKSLQQGVDVKTISLITGFSEEKIMAIK